LCSHRRPAAPANLVHEPRVAAAVLRRPAGPPRAPPLANRTRLDEWPTPEAGPTNWLCQSRIGASPLVPCAPPDSRPPEGRPAGRGARGSARRAARGAERVRLEPRRALADGVEAPVRGARSRGVSARTRPVAVRVPLRAVPARRGRRPVPFLFH